MVAHTTTNNIYNKHTSTEVRNPLRAKLINIHKTDKNLVLSFFDEQMFALYNLPVL